MTKLLIFTMIIGIDRKKILCLLLVLRTTVIFSQVLTDSSMCMLADSAVTTENSSISKVYRSSKPFSFLTGVPHDIVQLSKAPFQRKSLIPLSVIAGTTAVLFFLDEPIIKGTGNIFKKIGIDHREKFHTLVRIGDVTIIKYPGNINTVFYQLGDPTLTFLFAGGFFIHGTVAHNTTSLRTAGEITRSFLTSLIVVQTLKRITGRQSPNRATVKRGKWHWFPSLVDYQNDVTNYIAFPSGHMATMMSMVTVIAENYPEKKWIRPTGYALMALTSLAMLNNKVHWASDYPLGLAIGYLSAKIAHRPKYKKVKRNIATLL